MVTQPYAPSAAGRARRPLLITMAVLGTLISLLGGTGLFAALTDTARTGTNSVSSDDLAASADIQLATAAVDGTSGAITCGTSADGAFAEDLTTGLFTAADFGPNDGTVETLLCIQNVGSQTVSLSGLVDQLTDLDTACTGDEEVHGDTSCGGNLAGELSGNLTVFYATFDCSNASAALSRSGTSLLGNATTAAALGALAPGVIGCYGVSVYYPTDTDAVAVQIAQSDTVTWRFKFVAQAGS